MARNRDQGPRGGAEHLARIHGTEEDKVNCPFYFKIGACRHGERCSRQHHRPPFSQTILIQHMWQNPMCIITAGGGDLNSLDKVQFQDDFNEFYDEIFEEFKNYGKLEDVQVCENLGDHMVGNVYVKFSDEEDAETAVQALNGRYYAGRVLKVEYSPVTDFREARCRQYDEGTCGRGHYCNFMHVKEPAKELRKHLEKEYGFTGGRMKGIAGMNTMKMMTGGGGGGGGGGGSGGYRGDDKYGGGSGPPPRRDERSDRDRGGDRGRSDRNRDSGDSSRRRDRSRSREKSDRDRGGRDRERSDRSDRSGRDREVRDSDSRRPDGETQSKIRSSRMML